MLKIHLDIVFFYKSLKSKTFMHTCDKKRIKIKFEDRFIYTYFFRLLFAYFFSFLFVDFSNVQRLSLKTH